MNDIRPFYSGTSGLVLPVPNKQAFPEEYRAGTRLTYYASLFNSIEINSSFYKMPQAATYSKWVEQVPAEFRFTVKLWRGITHERGLEFKPADVDRFMLAAAGLGQKRGCLLVQLPPGAKADKRSQLERLLAGIVTADANRLWEIAVEFRDASWYTAETGSLLEQYKAGVVLQDIPASKILEPMGYTSFIYVRYHGPAGDYKGGYSKERLEQDASRIKSWLAEGREVYAYFNNTIGNALINVQELRLFVNRYR